MNEKKEDKNEKYFHPQIKNVNIFVKSVYLNEYGEIDKTLEIGSTNTGMLNTSRYFILKFKKILCFWSQKVVFLTKIVFLMKFLI